MSTEALRFIDALATGEEPGEVPPVARKTLHAVAAFMQERPDQPRFHRVCLAAQKSIAKKLGIGERTVRRHVAALETAGVITSNRQAAPGSGRGGCTLRIRIVGFSDQPAIVAVRSAGRRGDGEATKRPPCHDQPAMLAANTLLDTKGEEKSSANRSRASDQEELNWLLQAIPGRDARDLARWLVDLQRKVGADVASHAIGIAKPRVEQGHVRNVEAYIKGIARHEFGELPGAIVNEGLASKPRASTGKAQQVSDSLAAVLEKLGANVRARPP